jgi:type III secretion protein S
MSGESDIIERAFWVIVYGSAPALLVAALVGALVGLIQSIMQVQEQTVAYVLKFAAVTVVLLASSRWLMAQLTGLFEAIFQLVPSIVASAVWLG